MTEIVPELWSERDRAAVGIIQRAIADDDLLSAMLAIEGASPAVAVEAAKDLARLVGGVQYLLDTDLAAKEAGDRFKSLHHVLVRVFGLGGATDDDYYAPASSFLTSVLATRRGNPITVSALWILVGQAVGIDVCGVAFPGHFLVVVDGRHVDGFNGGIELAMDDLRALGERMRPGVRFEHAWVATANISDMVERMLRNVIHAHSKAGEPFGAYRALRLYAGLRPRDAAPQLDVAVQSEALGAWDEARGLYRDIIRAFPDSREAQVAELRRLEMQQRQRTLH